MSVIFVINDITRVGIEIPLKINLESSTEDEYEEPSSEEENENVAANNDDDGPVNDIAQVDYGFDSDCIGDSNFTLFSRRDVYLLRGWRAFVLERRNCAGFSVP